MKKLYFLILSCLFSFYIEAQVPPHSNSRDNRIQEGVKVPHYSPGTTSNGKFGVRYAGKVTIPAIYDELSSADKGIIAKKNGQTGILDVNGKIIIPFKYDKIATYFSFFIAQKDKKTDIYNNDFQLIASGDFAKVIAYNGEIITTDDYDGKQSFIFKNKSKIKNNYQEVVVYRNLLLAKKSDKYGIIKDGKEVTGFVYDELYFQKLQYSPTLKFNKGIAEIREFANYLIAVKDKKYGLINGDGKTVIPFDYERINLDYDKVSYYFFKNNLIGIFLNEQLKTDLQFQTVEKGDNLYRVKKNDKFLVLDNQLKSKNNVESEGPITTIMSSRFILLKKNGKFGLADTEGNLIIPYDYTGFDSFDYDFKDLVTVIDQEKRGLYDVKLKKLIIPAQYEYIFNYDKFFIGRNPVNEEISNLTILNLDGTKVFDEVFSAVYRSSTQNSPIYFLEKDNLLSVFTNNRKIVQKDILAFDYIIDEDLLVNPLLSNKVSIISLKHKNGKYALFNEFGMKTVGVFDYDKIVQKFAGDKVYFIVVKNGKYGIVDHLNNQVIGFSYDELSFSNASALEKQVTIVARKNKKYGAIDLENNTVIPFKYDYLEKISAQKNLFKAKNGKKYVLINGNDQILNKGPFDEISNFEGNEALSFNEGTVKLMSSDGKFTGNEQKMKPHNGYKTFDELKFALVDALNSKEDEKLKLFSQKIAPSAHLLYYLKENILDGKGIYLDSDNLGYISDAYFERLRKFKYQDWNSEVMYRRGSLTNVKDFTIYREGFVTNERTEDHAFGDTRFLESVLRNAIKVNGYWISSYFMNRKF